MSRLVEHLASRPPIDLIVAAALFALAAYAAIRSRPPRQET